MDSRLRRESSLAVARGVAHTSSKAILQFLCETRVGRIAEVVGIGGPSVKLLCCFFQGLDGITPTSIDHRPWQGTSQYGPFA